MEKQVNKLSVTYKRKTSIEDFTEAMTTTSSGTYISKKPKKIKWLEMLISRHSPIRSVRYRVYVKNVKYNSHVHLIRHHISFEPYVEDIDYYVQSQRVNIDRDELPQGEKINMMFDVNADSLLNLASVRMCNRVAVETREVLVLLKQELEKSDDIYDNILGSLMVPFCELNGWCKESAKKCCGKFNNIPYLFSSKGLDFKGWVEEIKNKDY